MSYSTIHSLVWVELVLVSFFIISCVYALAKIIFSKKADKVFLEHLVLGYFYLALAPCAYIFVMTWSPFFAFGYNALPFIFGIVFSILLVYKAIFTFAKGHKIETLNPTRASSGTGAENIQPPKNQGSRAMHHLLTFMLIPFVLMVSFFISAYILNLSGGTQDGGFGIIVVWPPVLLVCLVFWFIWRFKKK